jgi:hypothetical protein
MTLPVRTIRSVDDAIVVLEELGASARLVTHGRLVAEAADVLLTKLRRLGVEVDEAWVRAGAVLHDAGKVQHSAELEGPGNNHEEAGEALLLSRGIDKKIAQCCVSHARWKTMECAFEELLVALADALWKGVRRPALEEKVIVHVAERLGWDRWTTFAGLDECFEQIADNGPERLLRSRC